MAILPAFARFTEEAAIIGRLLAGYADLEIDLMHCVQVAREDLDGVLKSMFRARGNLARIDIADALGRQHYRKLGLDTEFADAVTAIRYCLKIRNQYAHCAWYDDNSGQLAFTNLEDIAKDNAVVEDLKGLRILHVDLPLLKEQFRYFEYADALVTWVNYEGRTRSGKLKQAFTHPSAVAQPALSR